MLADMVGHLARGYNKHLGIGIAEYGAVDPGAKKVRSLQLPSVKELRKKTLEDPKTYLVNERLSPGSAGSVKGRRVWGFRLAAIALGLLPFVALELGLRLFGVANPTAQRDPLAGFSRKHPLFEQAGDKYRTLRSREPFFGQQEFTAATNNSGAR